MSIAANRFPHIRAALIDNATDATVTPSAQQLQRPLPRRQSRGRRQRAEDHRRLPEWAIRRRPP
ncbi:hypothetical protein [Chthoniobacter flavus]|uniref:hypothetical protein n=1 Tax=Chthoniobacter flavus TaxID=191863 RepID=UPI003B43BFB2